MIRAGCELSGGVPGSGSWCTERSGAVSHAYTAAAVSSIERSVVSSSSTGGPESLRCARARRRSRASRRCAARPTRATPAAPAAARRGRRRGRSARGSGPRGRGPARAAAPARAGRQFRRAGRAGRSARSSPPAAAMSCGTRGGVGRSRSSGTHRTSCSRTTNRSASRGSSARPTVDLPVPLGPARQYRGRRTNSCSWPQASHTSAAAGVTRAPHRVQISGFTAQPNRSPRKLFLCLPCPYGRGESE